MSKRTYVLPSVTALFFAVTSTASSALTPDPETGLIPVRLPTDLCAFENGLPSDLVRQITPRADFNQLLNHMFANCPTLALGLADFATAAIDTSEFFDEDDDDDDDNGGAIASADPTSPGDTDGGTEGTDGGDTDGSDDTADGQDKNLPDWKIAKKNGIPTWKWEKKVARWERQREEREAYQAEKKANKNASKDLPDWKQAKKEERWAQEAEERAQRKADKKASKMSESSRAALEETESDEEDQVEEEVEETEEEVVAEAR